MSSSGIIVCSCHGLVGELVESFDFVELYVPVLPGVS